MDKFPFYSECPLKNHPTAVYTVRAASFQHQYVTHLGKVSNNKYKKNYSALQVCCTLQKYYFYIEAIRQGTYWMQ